MSDLFAKGEIHPTAIVSPDAELGRDVSIGAYAIVHGGVELGAGARVGPYVSLGEPPRTRHATASLAALRIGPGALIRSHTVIYGGSEIGEGFECGHHAAILPGAAIGRAVRVGSFADIEGRCRIGDHSRLHSNVFVCQGTEIGRYVWLFPHVVTTDDPHPPSHALVAATIDDYAAIGARAVLLPGIRIGREAVVGAAALVTRDVPPGHLVMGHPARLVGPASDVRHRMTGEAAYPWYRHFSKGMPWEGIGFDAWAARPAEAGTPAAAVPDGEEACRGDRTG
ncbi:MAG: N-acetyltransferase [Candidatus Sericytochromatia bacterium]|nr:N-acetyltransferase [Candidatus Tanganyikabacteria bacterium]